MSLAAGASLDGLAAALVALGDPSRLRLIGALGDGGPSTAARLAGSRDISRQAIDKQLRVLAAAGLVSSARRGRERIWRLRPGALGDVAQRLADAGSRWDAALERLRDLVEHPSR